MRGKKEEEAERKTDKDTERVNVCFMGYDGIRSKLTFLAAK